MKTLMLLLFLLITTGVFSQSQTKDTLQYTSVGNELIKFEKQYNFGFGLSLLGTGVAVIGSQQNDNRLVIGGGVVAVVGYFVLAQSHIHIRNAGLLMNENGIGVKIKIK